MIEWITLLLDSKFLMRANGILGFLLLGLFIFFYFLILSTTFLKILIPFGVRIDSG